MPAEKFSAVTRLVVHDRQKLDPDLALDFEGKIPSFHHCFYFHSAQSFI
jgi:hypothetical protein